ncbi:MAG: hypothetical protein ABL949_07700 [Fimbriimonadaceae bacterium]
MRKLIGIVIACICLTLIGCSGGDTAKSGGGADKYKEIEQQTKDAGGDAPARE